MNEPARRTAVVFGKLQSRELRLTAARQRDHGLQVMTMEQLACRLAGGFSRPIEDEALRTGLQAALPQTELGELDAIKMLPGMVDACVDTFRKVWTSRIDLTASGDHPRLTSLARLESAVLDSLPSGMKRPGELVDAALTRLTHAPAVLGPIDVLGMTELEPCWRPLLLAIEKLTKVRWVAGPRSVPSWLNGTGIELVTTASKTPQVETVSASTSIHEAIEALRWARQLVSSGSARPSDVAIASVAPNEFDDHFLALRADANLDLHFAHGIKVTATRDGQAAAALADIVLRGLTQQRFRRLVSLVQATGGPFYEFPYGWLRLLPTDAPLSSPLSWDKFLVGLKAEDWTDGKDHTAELRAVIELLQQGPTQAAAAGEALLRRRALGIWRKALGAGPAASLDLTLQSMRQDDGLEACESVVWMPASSLAASPRKHVRLLGLNSSRWPRRISEDRLLSDHIVPREQLDPLPASEADRRDFETILLTTELEVVLSYSRRDSDGRLLGRSGLLQGMPEAEYLRRHGQATHAFSETDRLIARPTEFRTTVQAICADRCWRNWNRRELTANDGMLRPEHPVALATLNRVQSASSLSLLLRNPQGFIWKYGLGLRAPELNTEPFVLDALSFGNLVHAVLDTALQLTVAQKAQGQAADIAAAVEAAMGQVASEWEASQPIPPRMLWQRTLSEVLELALYALKSTQQPENGWSSFSEVPFGGATPKSEAQVPWDATQVVVVPETGFQINGYIDRLDIADGTTHAAVFDYKTGRTPRDAIVLNGGKELQRCLYAFAVRALLGPDVSIRAALLYLRDQTSLRLEDSEAALANLQHFLALARASLQAGRAVPGIGAGDKYDDLALALPANASSYYCERKLPAVRELLGDATAVWEAQ
jgi:hypothetical protein